MILDTESIDTLPSDTAASPGEPADDDVIFERRRSQEVRAEQTALPGIAEESEEVEDPPPLGDLPVCRGDVFDPHVSNANSNSPSANLVADNTGSMTHENHILNSSTATDVEFLGTPSDPLHKACISLDNTEISDSENCTAVADSGEIVQPVTHTVSDVVQDSIKDTENVPSALSEDVVQSVKDAASNIVNEVTAFAQMEGTEGVPSTASEDTAQPVIDIVQAANDGTSKIVNDIPVLTSIDGAESVISGLSEAIISVTDTSSDTVVLVEGTKRVPSDVAGEAVQPATDIAPKIVHDESVLTSVVGTESLSPLSEDDAQPVIGTLSFNIVPDEPVLTANEDTIAQVAIGTSYNIVPDRPVLTSIDDSESVPSVVSEDQSGIDASPNIGSDVPVLTSIGAIDCVLSTDSEDIAQPVLDSAVSQEIVSVPVSINQEATTLDSVETSVAIAFVDASVSLTAECTEKAGDIASGCIVVKEDNIVNKHDNTSVGPQQRQTPDDVVSNIASATQEVAVDVPRTNTELQSAEGLEAPVSVVGDEIAVVSETVERNGDISSISLADKEVGLEAASINAIHVPRTNTEMQSAEGLEAPGSVVGDEIAVGNVSETVERNEDISSISLADKEVGLEAASILGDDDQKNADQLQFNKEIEVEPAAVFDIDKNTLDSSDKLSDIVVENTQASLADEGKTTLKEAGVQEADTVSSPNIHSDTSSAFAVYKPTCPKTEEEKSSTQQTALRRKSSGDDTKDKKGVFTKILEFVGVKKKEGDAPTASAVFYDEKVENAVDAGEEPSANALSDTRHVDLSPLDRPEPKKRSQSPRIDIPNVPQTNVIVATPPTIPPDDKPPRRDSSALTVDNVIPETPPVVEKKTPMIIEPQLRQQLDRDAIMEEIDAIVAKAKLIALDQIEDDPIYSNVVETVAAASTEPPVALCDDFEEIKVTPQQERGRPKDGPSSKLAGQILKAIPPPRRRPLSCSRPTDAPHVDVELGKSLQIVQEVQPPTPSDTSSPSVSPQFTEAPGVPPPVPPRRRRSKQRTDPQPPPKRKPKQ